MKLADNVTVPHQEVQVAKALSPQHVECKFPDANPFDQNIVKLAGLNKKTLTCDDYSLHEITFIDDFAIHINSSKVNHTSESIHCRYRNMTRPPYKDNTVMYSKWSENFTDYLHITDEHEFIFVECYSAKNQGEIVSKAFYSLVPKRAHLKKLYDVKLKKREKDVHPKETLNIIAVMLDGLPRHQMIRGMPKTYKFLTEFLKSFDFTMLGQAGEHTLPNLVNLLSPNSYYQTQDWWDFSKPEDVFDLIWHDFERAGYRTLFSEDDPKGAGFYWPFTQREFMYPQTSYCNRPLQLAMEDEPGFLWGKKMCAGSRPISEFQLEYLERLLDTFPKDPVAAISIITHITHNDITNAGLIDEHILNFYQRLADKGHLNRSLVMLFSDHGARWGKIRETYNGVLESKNPFLVLTFPPWFIKKYPEIARNLATNTRRLTSHSDTRQMFLDLLYFKGREPTPPYRGRHGLSLFNEIPGNRTCAEADIPSHQCLCGQKIKKFFATNSSTAVTFANALLQAVKKKSDPEKCEEYSLGQVMKVGELNIPTAGESHKKRYLVCRVRITVEPGGAMFEGIISKDKNTKTISVGRNIERLNMYKGEVECQPTSREQMYCYCKGNKPKNKTDSSLH